MCEVRGNRVAYGVDASRAHSDAGEAYPPQAESLATKKDTMDVKMGYKSARRAWGLFLWWIEIHDNDRRVSSSGRVGGFVLALAS